MTNIPNGKYEFTNERLHKIKRMNAIMTKEEIHQILLNQQRIGQIAIYCRLLQDGDPENENPKAILDYVDEVLNNTELVCQ